MRAALVFLTLSFTAIAGTLPDDAVLSQRLLGTWRGSRHETRYFADGTWMMGLVLPSGVYTLKRIPDAKLPRDK